MEHNGFEYIDLGLPSGTMWATMNVGANSIDDSGLFFCFGDKIGFTVNDLRNTYTSLKKRRLNLNPNDIADAANIYMGGKWRLPTKEEINELVDVLKGKVEIIRYGNGKYSYIFKYEANELWFPIGGYVDISTNLMVPNGVFLWSKDECNRIMYSTDDRYGFSLGIYGGYTIPYGRGITINGNPIKTKLGEYNVKFGHNIRGVVSKSDL